MKAPHLDQLPDGIVTVVDYARLAKQQLDPGIWQYLEAGSGAGLTQAANRRAFEAVPLTPRPLADVRGGHTRLELFGQPLEHPILLAPIAYQRLFHPDGECASSLAAAAQG
ncbi:MAG: alpha-hydroxy-acid oxidizing protein, partial [Pseudomonadota bacterium]